MTDVFSTMSFFGSNIASFFLAPFLVFSAWFGFHGYATTTQPVACTMEAKQCPDGSYVGRTGPACEFAACPSAPTTHPTPRPTPKPTPAPTPMPVSAVTVYSINPTSGPVGTTVDITGFGFTSDNIIHFGGGAIAHVASSGGIAIACTTDPNCHPGIRQTLEFTVPSSVGPYCAPGMACPMYMQLVTPGTYTVYVENANGTSNKITFTVTGSTGNTQPLSITGLDAPVTLALGQQGTWTVHVSVPDTVGQLHYSATWGDETNAAAQIMAPQPQQVQTSASFTHAYQRSGTYTSTFTVTDDNGHSQTTSSTITVTPLY